MGRRPKLISYKLEEHCPKYIERVFTLLLQGWGDYDYIGGIPKKINIGCRNRNRTTSYQNNSRARIVECFEGYPHPSGMTQA